VNVAQIIQLKCLVGLLAFGAFGVCVGALVNLGVYRLAWSPRSISPWSRPLPEAPPRCWHDRLPIIGWLGLRRECGLHGGGFWIRPMLVELFLGAGFAALYWWEICRLGLVLPGVLPPSPAVLYAQYGCHLVLVALMVVASLIDIDEKIIPDTITVSGTWFALLAAAVCPWSLLHATFWLRGGPVPNPPPDFLFLRLTYPNPWPDWLTGFPHAWPLAAGLGCWWLWCVALMHRTWYARHGWLRAIELLLARLRREASTWRILVMGLVGSAGIVVVWLVRGPFWAGLLTALVGMAASSAIIWAIRVLATAVLRREAMGFGDVTLMAMVGAFLGWQPCLIVFFLAPFAGLAVGLVGLALRHGPEIPYGPFLCLAALVVIVRWAPLWVWTAPIFNLGGILVLVLCFCLVMMVPFLIASRLVRTALEHFARTVFGD